MCPIKTIRFLLFLPVFFTLSNRAFSQYSGENPILFFDEFLGYAGGNAGGLALGVSVNYQVKRNFFTMRYLGTVKFGVEVINPLVPLPFVNVKNYMGEVAVLYGLRMIEDGHASSFSLGASFNQYGQNYDKFGENEKYEDYFGVPFEANFKWFKKEKQRFRIYGLIPVGPPTGFGGSIGFKLFGNISRQSYAGLGLTYGLGFHKAYQ